MRKNQKYTKEEMNIAIELFQESGLSQEKFCTRENIPFHVFKYWFRKYKREGNLAPDLVTHSFIPVTVAPQRGISAEDNIPHVINIIYPNGVQLSCPVKITPQQLRILINL